jgi:hypothetical protein
VSGGIRLPLNDGIRSPILATDGTQLSNNLFANLSHQWPSNTSDEFSGMSRTVPAGGWGLLP